MILVLLQGLMSRVNETVMVLGLLAVVVLGIAWVISSLIDEDHHSKQQLFGVCCSAGWCVVCQIRMQYYTIQYNTIQ